MTLENLLSLLKSKFNFLFTEEGFNVSYTFERLYPVDIRVGLESSIHNIKLLFLHEWATSLFIGPLNRTFEDITKLFYFEHLLDYINKHSLRWPSSEPVKNYNEFVINNLITIGKEFKRNQIEIYNLFKDEKEIQLWEAKYRSYIDIEFKKRYKIK
jgi:hypothetical protein